MVWWGGNGFVSESSGGGVGGGCRRGEDGLGVSFTVDSALGHRTGGFRELLYILSGWRWMSIHRLIPWILRRKHGLKGEAPMWN